MDLKSEGVRRQGAVEIVSAGLHLHRQHRQLETARLQIRGLGQIDVLLQDDRLEARAGPVFGQPLAQHRLLHAEDSRQGGKKGPQVWHLVPIEPDVECDPIVGQDTMLVVGDDAAQRHQRHPPQAVVV